MSLIIKGQMDIVRYCSSRGIALENFNEPVEISSSIKTCFFMFCGCKSFNQPVIIPENVIDCSYMFYGCYSFNQDVVIPAGVTDCRGMFVQCEKLNKQIKLLGSSVNCDGMFINCMSMKSSVITPDGPVSCKDAMFGNGVLDIPYWVPEDLVRVLDDRPLSYYLPQNWLFYYHKIRDTSVLLGC